MIRRAAVIGTIVACLLAAAIAGYNGISPSGERHAQVRVVPAPAALPDFSALVAAYGSAVVNIAATQTVRASDPASGRGVIARVEGSGFIVSPDGVILTSAHLVDRADTIVVTLTDRVRLGSLGVSTQDLTQRFADSVGLGTRQGALVIAVEEHGPAVRAGLQPGDVILSMDGTLISEANELPPGADFGPGRPDWRRRT